MVVSMSCQRYLLLSTLLLMLVSVACVSSLLPAEASAEAYSAQLAENEAGSRRAGRDRKMGVPELELSQCDTNPLRLREFGNDMAATDALFLVAGTQGAAVAQCLGNCKAPYLQYDWQGPGVNLGPDNGQMATTAQKFMGAGPACARGQWLPATPPRVRVAAHSSTAVFAAAGCVEVWELQDSEVWTHIESLPSSLDLADDEQLVPSDFGAQVSIGDDVMAVSVTVHSSGGGDGGGGSGGGADVPAVAMYVRISRKEWVLAEVIKCQDPVCRHKPQPCSSPGSFQVPTANSPTGCLGGGFGSAVALQGKWLVVSIPNNNTVAVYKQQGITGVRATSDAGGSAWKAESMRGGAGAGEHNVGASLTWQLTTFLTGPLEGADTAAFGASLAISSNVVVVGLPAAEQPLGGALVYSLLESAQSGAELGDIVLDVRQECCKLKLPCCQAAYVGRAMASKSQGDTEWVVVGDPANDAAVLVDCDVRRMKNGGGGHDSSAYCSVATYVTAPAAGSDKDRRNDARAHGRGLGASVALGNEVVFLGNPAAACAADEGGSASKDAACGQVCHAALCSPGSCLLYDWSLNTHICLDCGDTDTCMGGVEFCSMEQMGILPFLLIGVLVLLSLCCCLCAFNLRYVIVSNNMRFSGCLGLLLDLCCCIPRAGDADDEREERLLDAEEGAGEAEDEQEEDDGDPVGKGYLPPAVSKALRAMAGERKKLQGSEGIARNGQKCEKGSPGSAGGVSGEAGSCAEGEERCEEGETRLEDGDEGAQARHGGRRRAAAGVKRKPGGEEGDAVAAKSGSQTQIEGNEAAVQEERVQEEEGEEEEGHEAEEEGTEEEEEAAAEAEAAEEERHAHCEDPEDGDEKIGISIDYFCCKMCKQRAIETVLVPCGHKALCKRCGHGIKVCIICKAQVTRVQTVYHV